MSSNSSTGHFPGAPFNTDPITTTASSTTEPVTSPSSASQVTPAPFSQAAPLSVTSQPRSMDPKTTSSEDPRATSSASNTAGGDQPPGSVDPATTSNTDSTTTTSTSTGTAGTSTTTTTTTTTTASNETTMMPEIPPETLFHEAIKRCNNCLFLVRKLRSKQNIITSLCLSHGADSFKTFLAALQHYKNFEAMFQDVMFVYEKLEHIARRLPKVVPPIDNINVMRTLYTQEHTMCHTDIAGLLEKMIDSGNWNEGNFQIFHYLSELLRTNAIRKANKYPEVLPLPRPVFNSTATTGHLAFENAYDMMKKEIKNKSLGIYPRTLFRSSSSLIIELLFGCGGAKVEKAEKENIVYTMKFLLIERNGTIEYINMIAVNEMWTFSNHYGEPQVNPFVPSCYEVYRRLTRQANIHLLNCFGTHASRWTPTTLLQFISLFGKFREVFTSRCRVCKMMLKNFLPPLIFDIRTPTIAAHEACR